jgi:hypothetical protein
MRNPLLGPSCVGGFVLVFVLAIPAHAVEVNRPDHGLALSATTSAIPSQPCPTCVEAVGLEAFRASIPGTIVPVIVELQEPPGVRARIAAEQAGRAEGLAEIISHSAGLRARQRAFIAALPGQGVRALLRQTNVRQIDGSVRHIDYQLTYLLNGFVAFVPEGDLPRLRALPEVRNVYQMQPTRLLLDKAIDYSLGTQTNLADRRLAVYGPTQEFQPAGAAGHAEAPRLTATDGFEGQGMNIAIIDTGADWRHPMFGGIGQLTPQPHVSGQPESTNDNRKIIYYYALSSPGDPTDDFGHGTLVTSCAAGYLVDGTTAPRTGYGTGRDGTGIGPTPNNVQLHGMAPQARIMAYKVCGPANNCVGDIELAIEDAASPYTLVGNSSAQVTNTFIPKPVADVINLSLGDTTGDPAGSTSVMANNAALAGTIVVAAAGNTGPGAGTIGSPAAATLTISAAASYDPGSLSVSDLLAANQIPGETRTPGLAGPPPETGAASDANAAQPGGRQTMKLFPVAGGGPIPNGSLSAHYVFVNRQDNTSTIPPEVQNRIALAKGSGTFAQIANAIAPFHPAAIVIITTVDNATAATVVGSIPTFTIGVSDGNYLIDQMLTGDPGDGDDSVDVPVGTISQLPLRLAESATLASFQPGMASFSSRGPNSHANARFRVVKPDVAAPGAGILGAATPDGVPSETIGLAEASGYVQASGTSFASPITAGSMALVRQRVRGLGLDSTNVAAVHYRSTRFDAVTVARALLMNSASNLRSGLGFPQPDGLASSASINDFGAGHINLDGALHANAIMVAPTLLLAGLGEFIAPTNDPFSSGSFDSQGNLTVLIPSSSFGAVPIVGVNASMVETQTVILRDVTGGAGGGTYNLSFQNNRNADQPGFQIAFVSAGGSPISSVSLPANGQATFVVRVTANGNLIHADPTEFQWFVTATHSVSGQKLRMPFYFRAVAPEIPNLTSPVQQILADQPPQAPSTCVGDTNSSYTIQWTYTAPSGGPAPVGYRVQEATRTAELFFDPADEALVAGANSTWTGGSDWSSQVNPDSGSVAYYVPDSANQNSSLTMLNSVAVPAGGATLSFRTSQDFEDGFDKGFVEVSTDAGVTFATVASYMNNFKGTRITDISPFAGQSIKIRFRMVSDLLNGPPDPAPLGWYIEDIRISSDDFQTIATLDPSASSLAVRARPNGTYFYRVAGLFTSDLGTAPGPYSDTSCVTENIGVPIIASITLLGNGHTLLNCLGTAGVAHRIEAGGDFLLWNTLGTRTAAGNGTFQFEDTNAVNFSLRFYRLAVP